MSVINKEPFIKKLLKTLTDQELKTLANLIDGKGDRTYLKRTMNPTLNGGRIHISVSDKGVYLCNLQLECSLFNGYLIYNNFFCVLIYFTDAQVLGMFNIDVAKTKLATVDEALSVVELRSVLDDFLIEAGELGELVEIKEVENLPAEGEEDTIYLSDSNIVNPTEGPVNVPKPIAADVGKVLEATADGNYRLGPTIEGAIQADKDIIDKIEVVYDDGGDFTQFIFPEGIVPLCISLNTHVLYINNGYYVDYQGNPVEGYDFDDLYVEHNHVIMSFAGDLSEQVINNLTYCKYDGTTENICIFQNTYNLFYPKIGTKLYKHILVLSAQGYNDPFIIISTGNKVITSMNANTELPKCLYYSSNNNSVLSFGGYSVGFVKRTSGGWYTRNWTNNQDIPANYVSDTVEEL